MHLIWLTTLLLGMAPVPHGAPTIPPSPLALYSPEWNKPEYLRCNTAAQAPYLSQAEKEVIYILNLVRVNPPLFARTVVARYPELGGSQYLKNSDYYKSLLDTLAKVKPLPLLLPEKTLFESARCHAAESGKTGYVGHDRTTAACEKLERYSGECCQYGYSRPLQIVMSLLIDEGVPSLGHRKILLSGFSRVGVSVQPHSGYGTNTVIDLD
jgi:uncharacterized protein YkwD